MDIQSIFYFLASIFLILGIGVMGTILVFLWRLKTSAEAFKKKATENIHEALNVRKFAGFIPLIGMLIKLAADRRNKQTS